MFKTFFKLVLLLVLLIISFVYTNGVFTEAKKTNPVMKEIINYKKTHDVKPVEPIIIDNELIIGLSGLEVDENTSYKNMTNSKFDENKIVYNKELPKNTINNNYDYYIKQGNTKNKNISIVFKIQKSDNVDELLSLINKNKLKINLFVDGKFLENNETVLKENKNLEIYNLGYNGKYKNNTIRLTNNLIESITLKKSLYCLNENKDENTKKICSKNKMYSIKPEIINPDILEVKKELKNGVIIVYDLESANLNEFLVAINYIKQKGYNIIGLSELIKE